MNDVTTPTSESEARLPRPPGALRRWLAAHPRFVDYFILVNYFIGAVPLTFIMLSVGGLNTGAGVLAPIILVVQATLGMARLGITATALVFRRSHPLIGLIGVTVALIGEDGPLIIANTVALWFLLYAVAVYQGVRAGWIGYAIAVAGKIISSFVPSISNEPSIFGSSTPRDATVSIIMDALWMLAVLMIAINLGNRRRYLSAVIERANQLARERDQLAQLAVAEERSRIAREIHDIVAHSVSVMIALSEGGARVVDAAPAEAANAMRRSAETGRTALAEMRRLLGALQSDEAAELAPQPSIEQVGDLVRGFQDAGLSVELVDEGLACNDRLQGLAMYRVVQEGLTNVLRYAGEGARVTVSMRRVPDGSEIIVRDYGRAPGATGPVTGIGSGRGLAGLAERVRVFGGTIESGPVHGERGWELTARFPNAKEPAGRQLLEGEG